MGFEQEQIAWMPFPDLPFPCCCISNVVGKGGFPGPCDNFYGFCGPLTGMARFAETVLPQPANPSEFDAFAQQAIMGMAPPDGWTPTMDMHNQALPPDWEEKFDPATSRTYFHNASTGQTTWDRPGSPAFQTEQMKMLDPTVTYFPSRPVDNALFGADEYQKAAPSDAEAATQLTYEQHQYQEQVIIQERMQEGIQKQQEVDPTLPRL